MAVTERLMGAGNFSVTFSQEQTPTAIIEAIKEWGHIVITPQEVDIDTLSDSGILSAARYTGIILNRTLEEGSVSINGQGLELYMGDGQAKGMVIAESNNVGKVRTYTGTTLAETLFNSTAQTNKPLGIMRDEAGNSQAITQGTITNPAGTYTGSHFVETALSALKFVCEILNVEYKVNPNGTLDAGPSANLFEGVGTSQPNSIIVKTAYGQDPEFEGVVPQGLRTEFDATDWVSRVDFTGEVGFFDTATDVAGEANLGTNPYKDLHGNALKRVGLVQEPDVPEANLNTRATTLLNELSRVKKVLNLDLEQYEVTGDMKVGDFIYAFDPDVGFKDTAADAAAESRSLYEITFRGQTITPVKIRVLGITFPITSGMGCYFRDKDGNYTDLTQYVQYETGAAQIELGDLIRTIGDDLRFSEFSLSRSTAGAFSIPNLPATPTLQAGTYLNATGVSSGFIRVTVARPTNLDGSQITDGSHYKVRYKKTTDSEYSYQNFPYTGASSESLLIQDMTVGVTYDVGVAVVDKSGFKAMSAYDGSGSDLYTNSSSVNANFATNARVEIEKDGQAPSKPKTATSIATGPLKVQITHHLGKDGTDGNGNPYGNFTLEGDLDYLAVHAVAQSGNSANFTVSASNKIGEIRVTAGNLLQSIPLVGSADLADSSGHYFRFVAVDKSGNASNPSDGQTGTASLIEETHIKDATITDVKIGTAQITGAKIANATITDANIGSLNADKINAGTISADRIGADSITAAKIASNTITATEIAADTITASQIASGTITATEIASGTITSSQLNFTPVSNSNIVASINASSEGITIDADTLNLTGTLSVGDALDIGGSDTTSFHVDTAGNMWLGAASYASAPFKVSNAGAVSASSYALTNGTITNPSIELATDTGTSAPTAASSTALKIGTSTLFERSNKLFSSKPFVVFPDGDEDNPSLTISGDYDELGFFVSNSTDFGGFSTFSASNGADDIFSFNTMSTQFNVKGNLSVEGSSMTVNGDSGGNSQFLGYNSSGTLGFHTITTASHDHDSSYSATSHDHDSDYYSASAGAVLASSLSSHTGHATALSLNSNVSNNDSGGLFVTAVSGLGITRTNVAGTTMDTQKVRPHVSESYAIGESGKKYTIGYFQFGTSSSDERLKENIESLDLGLDFINKLEPKKYNWTTETITLDNGDEIVKRQDIANMDMFGFLAQDVLAIDDLDDDTTYGIARHIVEEDSYEISNENFIAPLVKAVQELSARVEALEG